MALAGSGRGLGDVAQVTLIQARAADEVRSRVFAAQDGLSHLAFTVSAFSGGLLVTLASARGAFAVAAAWRGRRCLPRGQSPNAAVAPAPRQRAARTGVRPSDTPRTDGFGVRARFHPRP